MNDWISNLIKELDLTQVFKTKGDLRRWSAKRTIGGIIVLTACQTILTYGITWQAVALACVGIIPISLSMFEK